MRNCRETMIDDRDIPDIVAACKESGTAIDVVFKPSRRPEVVSSRHRIMILLVRRGWERKRVCSVFDVSRKTLERQMAKVRIPFEDRSPW